MIDSECIEAERIDSLGYPRLSGYDGRGHRYVWEQAHGPLEKGLVVHHVCENKACVNIDHLEALTIREHNFRHRRCTHPEYERRWGSDGRLRCCACRREREKERYATDPDFRAKRKASALRRHYARA